jgi:hypothetical protein
VRKGLVEEFQQRGRNSEFIDKRIGEKSSRLSEEEKMKLRFMKEQRDQLKNPMLALGTRKRNKYNLDLEDDEEERDFNMNFLTHKGKRLEDMDDFKDRVNDSSDEYEDKDLAKGLMNDEMVNALNFGGGEPT